MWHFIGWFILFLCVMSIENKIDKLCANQGIVCVEKTAR